MVPLLSIESGIFFIFEKESNIKQLIYFFELIFQEVGD